MYVHLSTELGGRFLVNAEVNFLKLKNFSCYYNTIFNDQTEAESMKGVM